MDAAGLLQMIWAAKMPTDEEDQQLGDRWTAHWAIVSAPIWTFWWD